MLPNLASANNQQNPFPPSLLNASPDGSMPFSGMDPYAAKQMAALQATSLAKAANRSAPGGTSASYFGGMSINNPPRPDPSSVDIMNGAPPFPPSGVPGFQAQQHLPNQQGGGHPNAALMQQQSHHQRKRSFLNGMANLMLQRGVPLPPNLTGIPYPQGYDPSNSPWRTLDVNTNDLGTVRLAGKDVDLFKLWALVLQLGGGQKVLAQGLWGQLLPHFDLPEHISSNGQQSSTTIALSNLYAMIIGPFESAYRKNMQEQQHRAMLARNANPSMPGHPRPDGMGGMANFAPQMNSLQRQPSNPSINPATMGGMGTSPQNADPTLGSMGSFPTPPSIPQIPQQFPGLSSGPGPRAAGLGIPDVPSNGSSSPQPGANGFPSMFPGSGSEMAGLDGEAELEMRKRKLRESEELDVKRVRQKTGGSDASDGRASLGPPSISGHAPSLAPGRTIRQPSRRKIEYIPFARELDTAGGRDLDALVHELTAASHRPMRHIDEWGNVDLDALTMSIRSRISTELSYALTTFTILTLMRGSASGFPAIQAPDLVEELLDLLEDLAFDGEEEDEGSSTTAHMTTQREIITYLVDDGAQPFAGLQIKQGAKDPKLGPTQRPGDIIRTTMNILRNLSNSAENHDYFARHERLLPLALRLCMLKPAKEGAIPMPASSVLSLADLVAIRKDVTLILVNIGGNVRLAAKMPPTPTEMRNARRAFELIAAYLTDLNEANSPIVCFVQAGAPSQMYQPKPPSSTDSALEAFTRLSQSDDNRQVFSRAVPDEWLWSMFEALVHRLPIGEQDFSVIMREVWLAYFERIIHCLYSLAFLSPPTIKKRAKEDKQLRFPKVMLRLIKKLSSTPRDLRHHFMVSVRRAVETVKLVDDAEDSFDTTHSSSMPTLSFGMGYGEHGETRLEKGMGLLSGYQEDVTMGIMMIQDLDDMVFSELTSLVRVG